MLHMSILILCNPACVSVSLNTNSPAARRENSAWTLFIHLKVLNNVTLCTTTRKHPEASWKDLAQRENVSDTGENLRFLSLRSEICSRHSSHEDEKLWDQGANLHKKYGWFLHFPYHNAKSLQCFRAIQRLDCLIVWGCLGFQSYGSAPRDTGQIHSICWKGMTGVQRVCVFEVYTHTDTHTQRNGLCLNDMFLASIHTHSWIMNACVLTSTHNDTQTHTFPLCEPYTYLVTHETQQINTDTEGNLSWFCNLWTKRSNRSDWSIRALIMSIYIICANGVLDVSVRVCLCVVFCPTLLQSSAKDTTM